MTVTHTHTHTHTHARACARTRTHARTHAHILVPTFLFNRYFILVTSIADNPMSQTICSKFYQSFCVILVSLYVIVLDIDRKLTETWCREFYLQNYDTTESNFMLFILVGVL
jgi:hypothetical protein